MYIKIDVSKNFEPGAETIGDFVHRAAVQLLSVQDLLNTGEFDGDLQGAVEKLKPQLIEVVGEY